MSTFTPSMCRWGLVCVCETIRIGRKLGKVVFGCRDGWGRGRVCCSLTAWILSSLAEIHFPLRGTVIAAVTTQIRSERASLFLLFHREGRGHCKDFSFMVPSGSLQAIRKRL